MQNLKKIQLSNQTEMQNLKKDPVISKYFFKFYFFAVIYMSNMGFELTILRWRVTCFSGWASQAPQIISNYLTTSQNKVQEYVKDYKSI